MNEQARHVNEAEFYLAKADLLAREAMVEEVKGTRAVGRSSLVLRIREEHALLRAQIHATLATVSSKALREALEAEGRR